ncbi:response regulator [Kallotenue papyrolyticum]|uniref:response regulator n=1 Tax=Kallotenue papyrolyticum TaxID=1325125 RepID=UPI00047861CD|nr:response regulator [Kallotenue papyrolyticum]
MSGPTILVVEDNPDNMYVLDHLLTRKGYTVRQAVRGDEALALVEQVRPALVLLDMQMPGLDGYGVVRELRRRPEWASLPIIAVTASSMPGDREQTLAAGCTDYLAKPISPRELLQMIEHYLRGAGHGNDSGR